MIVSVVHSQDQQDLFNILSAVFIVLQVIGTNNCSSVIAVVASERSVLYREMFSGMYSSYAYSFAQVNINFQGKNIDASTNVNTFMPYNKFLSSQFSYCRCVLKYHICWSKHSCIQLSHTRQWGSIGPSARLSGTSMFRSSHCSTSVIRECLLCH